MARDLSLRALSHELDGGRLRLHFLCTDCFVCRHTGRRMAGRPMAPVAGARPRADPDHWVGGGSAVSFSGGPYGLALGFTSVPAAVRARPRFLRLQPDARRLPDCFGKAARDGLW